MTRKFINLALILVLLFVGNFTVFADEDLSSTTFPFKFTDEEKAKFSVDQSKISENQSFLNRFQKEVQNSKTNYRQILSNISNNEYELQLISDQKIDLKFQLENIDSLILDSKNRFDLISENLSRTENDVKMLKEDIRIDQVAQEYQKAVLAEYIRLIYMEENKLDPYSLLLSPDSVSENLDQIKYFNLLNDTGTQILDTLDEIYTELKHNESLLSDKKIELTALYNAALVEKENLASQKEAKERFLVATEGKEKIYQQLLEQSKVEQEEALTSVQLLSQSLSLIQREFQAKGENFDYADYMSLLTDKEKSLYEFQLRYRGLGSEDFAWPLDPFRGISAYFRDPTYSSAFKVGHNAIDIPAYQGSFVHAARDGVVYTAKDNGYGYSYIVIAHSDGYSTVYGHISDILVDEGNIVSQGMVIGLSGGMPGTKGAGYMTTGPHLHFEMLQNGDYVDPLLNLPLEELDAEHIKNLPVKYKNIWDVRVMQVRKDKGILLKREGGEDV